MLNHSQSPPSQQNSTARRSLRQQKVRSPDRLPNRRLDFFCSCTLVVDLGFVFMDASRLPIAADNREDISVGVVTFPKKQLANLSHHGRPRIAVDPLGCLSLLDQDMRNKNWIANMKVKTQPTVNVQRPRAILSSPENDELSCELQQVAEEISDIAIAPPKAPLSPPEGLIRTGARSIFVAENSTPSTDINKEDLDVSQSPTDSLEHSNSRISRPKVNKGKSIGQYTMLESSPVSSRSGNDENLLTRNVRNRVAKQQVCSPSSTPSSIGLKLQTSKPMTKGDSGRVVRPWY